MTQEQKQLLIKDLCARLPYGVIIEITSWGGTVGASYDMRLDAGLLADLLHSEDDFKPYLRPMSSMDEMERSFFRLVSSHRTVPDGFGGDVEMYSLKCIDWLNAHHFDYCIDPCTNKTLIESGLAIEAPEGMYKDIHTGLI